MTTAAVPTELTQHSAPDRNESKPESAGPVNREGRQNGGNPARDSGISLPADPPEMRKPEARRIFQPVAERPVDADRGEPDQRDGEGERRGEAEAERQQRHRRHVAVG